MVKAIVSTDIVIIHNDLIAVTSYFLMLITNEKTSKNIDIINLYIAIVKTL